MMRPILSCWLLALVPCLAMADEPDALTKARKLLHTGKYAESLEAFDALAPLAKDHPDKVQVALGRAGCLAATGEIDKALEALKPFCEGEKPDPDASARAADLEFSRGHWTEAEALARAATKARPDHVPAKWVLARLLEAKGQAKEADAAFRWFIDQHNKDQKAPSRDAEALVIIGQAAEKYYRANARGEDLKETLEEVMNDLYENAIRADPTYWKAPLMEARLFLSGYNERAATKELIRRRRSIPERRKSWSRWARPTCRATSSPRGGNGPRPPSKSTRIMDRPTSCWPT